MLTCVDALRPSRVTKWPFNHKPVAASQQRGPDGHGRAESPPLSLRRFLLSGGEHVTQTGPSQVIAIQVHQPARQEVTGSSGHNLQETAEQME